MKQMHDFFTVYQQELVRHVYAAPDVYQLLPEDTPERYAARVTAKFLLRAEKLEFGRVHTNTMAMRSTCRVLGFKYSHKAVEDYIYERKHSRKEPIPTLTDVVYVAAA